MTWLVISIALSVLLTVVLNVGLRLFSGGEGRVARRLTQPTVPSERATGPGNHRVRVWTPWKAMIVGSLILTIVVNLGLWIARE